MHVLSEVSLNSMGFTPNYACIGHLNNEDLVSSHRQHSVVVLIYIRISSNGAMWFLPINNFS